MRPGRCPDEQTACSWRRCRTFWTELVDQELIAPHPNCPFFPRPGSGVGSMPTGILHGVPRRIRAVVPNGIQVQLEVFHTAVGAGLPPGEWTRSQLGVANPDIG